MPYRTRLTYLCYDNSDLIRDGAIPNQIKRTWKVSEFNMNKLKNPAKGIRYKIIYNEDGSIKEIEETKKLVPANKLKLEIDFSKVMDNAVTHPIPTDLFPGGVGSFFNGFMSGTGFGGLTSGVTEFTIQILDSGSKINKRIEIDDTILSTEVVGTFINGSSLTWESTDGYPLSIFAIVKEHRELIGLSTDEDIQEKKALYKKDHPQSRFEENEKGEVYSLIGIDFQVEDLDKIGQYSDGAYEGVARKRIKGGTDSNGQFGGVGIPYVQFVPYGTAEEGQKEFFKGQENLFLEIIKDPISFKFRADNQDSSGDSSLPPKAKANYNTDATSKKIRFKKGDLKKGDVVYITYEYATNRHVRESLRHKGTIAQGNTVYGSIGWSGAIESEVEAFNYALFSWPVVPNRSGYKITYNEYESGTNNQTEVEGWRISENINRHYLTKFWGADYRGIWLYDNGVIYLVVPRASIRDQEWFIKYLESLEFTYPTGDPDPNDPTNEDGTPKYTYKSSDLEVAIDKKIENEETGGFLYDISEVSNSLLYDLEKIPYYRPLAKALMSVSKFNKDDVKTGIGFIQLDLYNKSYSASLSKYDLSFAEFYLVNEQPSKTYSCESPFDVTTNHYWSEAYNSSSDQPWLMYSSDMIEPSIYGWKPPGGYIESYWKLETPYFCGNFKADTRIYTEMMGGKSLDNFSWIYVDTDPYIPNNITSDRSYYSDISVLVFQDEMVNNSLSYHYFSGYNFSQSFVNSLIDLNRSHERPDEYEYGFYESHGYNRMLGAYPSYGNGIPIIYDTSKVCIEGDSSNFWFEDDLLNGKAIVDGSVIDYNLSFSDEEPTASLKDDFAVRRIEIEYSWKNPNNIDGISSSGSLYFLNSDSTVDKIYFSKDLGSNSIKKVEVFINYYKGPFKFIGDIWKKINIHKIKAIINSPSIESNSKGLNIDNYKLNEGQSSVVLDGMGRIILFYSNSETGNIDAAVSQDEGRSWYIHYSLIRLIEGEVATFPVAIKARAKVEDINNSGAGSMVKLFYILNDLYIMCKDIQVDLFDEIDAFIRPKVPSSYDVGDYDFSIANPDASYWSDQNTLSERGLSLRRVPSYIVAGSSTDEWFKAQMEITRNLHTQYQTILDPNNPDNNRPYKVQYARFEYEGSKSNLKDNYSGSTFGLHIDHEGVIRLFFESNGKLTIKSSVDFYSWIYDVVEVNIHRIYKSSEKNEGISTQIQNVQIVQNDYDALVVPLLYFNNEMLFVRYLDISILYPTISSDKDDRGDLIRQRLEIQGETNDEFMEKRSIFLIGEIPEEMRTLKVQELEDNLTVEESDFVIFFPYNKDMISKMDSRFAIDSATQPCGFTYKDGLQRIFYKDSLGNLNGLILNGRDNVIPECMLVE